MILRLFRRSILVVSPCTTAIDRIQEIAKRTISINGLHNPYQMNMYTIFALEGRDLRAGPH